MAKPKERVIDATTPQRDPVVPAFREDVDTVRLISAEEFERMPMEKRVNLIKELVKQLVLIKQSPDITSGEILRKFFKIRDQSRAATVQAKIYQVLQKLASEGYFFVYKQGRRRVFRITEKFCETEAPSLFPILSRVKDVSKPSIESSKPTTPQTVSSVAGSRHPLEEAFELLKYIRDNNINAVVEYLEKRGAVGLALLIREGFVKLILA